MNKIEQVLRQDFSGETNGNKKTELELIGIVRKAINRAARFLPWNVRCFEEAISGKRLLKEIGLPSTLYLGAKLENSKNLRAHAWLKCGEVFVVGMKGYKQFRVVAFYK